MRARGRQRATTFRALVDSQVLPRNEDDMALVEAPSPGTVVEPDGSVRAVRPGTVALAVGGPYEIALDNGCRVADIHVGDLWAMAGQSNMMGGGELPALPVTVEQARALGFDGRWKPAVEPLHRLWECPDAAPLRTARRLFYADMGDEEWDELVARHAAHDSARPIGGVGPGASFARAITSATGVPVGLLPCALGSTSLADWSRGWSQAVGVPFADGLFGNLVTRAKRYGPLRGVLWYQGEGDSGPEPASTYLERFHAFVTDLRHELALPDLPVVAVQIGRYDLVQLEATLGLTVDPADVAGWIHVRDALRTAADRIEHVGVVAAADLGLIDGVHLDADAQNVLGRRLALVAEGFLPGGKQRRSPRLVSVEAAGNRGSLRLRFGDVEEGLRVVRACDFAVAPGAQVVDVRVDDHDSVLLEFDRPPALPASLVYGPGLNPSVGIVDGDLPVPLFGPVSIP